MPTDQSEPMDANDRFAHYVRPTHPIKPLFDLPFGYDERKFGVFGAFANAFLAGALDAYSCAPEWYSHPCLDWRCRFVEQGSLRLVATWPAEWLAHLRAEGVTSLKIHWEKCDALAQTNLAPDGSGESLGLILSAWGVNATGMPKQISCWSPSFEESVAWSQWRRERTVFPFPHYTPGSHTYATITKLEGELRGVPAEPPTGEALVSQLNEMYAMAGRGGYLPPCLCLPHEQRVRYSTSTFVERAREPESDELPSFVNDTQADIVRSICIDAGVLTALLKQVPKRIPENPYDELNVGTIYPESDARGEIYGSIDSGIRKLGWQWMLLCYRPWKPSFSMPATKRLVLRNPVDLVSMCPSTFSNEGFDRWVRPWPDQDATE